MSIGASSILLQSCDKELDEYFIIETSLDEFQNSIVTIYPEIKKLHGEHKDLIDLLIEDKENPIKSTIAKRELQYLENDMERILDVVYQKSYSLLIDFGFTHDELLKESDNFHSPDIVYMAFLTSGFINVKDQGVSGFKAAYTNEDSNDWYDCLLRSVGIDAVIEIVNSKTLGSAAAKRLIKKAVRKVASRALGWIGVGIAVYEFGDCMGYY